MKTQFPFIIFNGSMPQLITILFEAISNSYTKAYNDFTNIDREQLFKESVNEDGQVVYFVEKSCVDENISKIIGPYFYYGICHYLVNKLRLDRGSILFEIIIQIVLFVDALDKKELNSQEIRCSDVFDKSYAVKTIKNGMFEPVLYKEEYNQYLGYIEKSILYRKKLLKRIHSLLSRNDVTVTHFLNTICAYYKRNIISGVSFDFLLPATEETRFYYTALTFVKSFDKEDLIENKIFSRILTKSIKNIFALNAQEEESFGRDCYIVTNEGREKTYERYFLNANKLDSVFIEQFYKSLYSFVSFYVKEHEVSNLFQAPLSKEVQLETTYVPF